MPELKDVYTYFMYTREAETFVKQRAPDNKTSALAEDAKHRVDNFVYRKRKDIVESRIKQSRHGGY